MGIGRHDIDFTGNRNFFFFTDRAQEIIIKRRRKTLTTMLLLHHHPINIAERSIALRKPDIVRAVVVGPLAESEKKCLNPAIDLNDFPICRLAIQMFKAPAAQGT